MATIPGVSNNELIRTTWGNAVANELNNNAVKADGTRAMTAALIITANPALRLRRSTTNDPLLYFEHTTGTPRYGYLQGAAAGLVYGADAGGHRWLIGGGEFMELAANLLKLPGTVRVGGTAGSNFQVVDNNGGGTTLAQANIGFYPNATSIDSIGTRGAYVGYAGEGFQVQSAAGLVLQGVAGDVTVEAGTARVITFHVGAAQIVEMSATDLLVGKTAAGLGAVGAEIGSNGALRSTVSQAGAPGLYLRHEGSAAAVDEGAFIQFAQTGGGLLADITQRTTVGVNIHNAVVSAPSDYRLKNELGPVPAPLERIKVLRPKRLEWKDGGGQFDGFIAHEVADVVPTAVVGAKDAVNDDGTAAYQSVDTTPIVALLTAGLQEAVAEIDALRTRVEQLEAAAA